MILAAHIFSHFRFCIVEKQSLHEKWTQVTNTWKWLC